MKKYIKPEIESKVIATPEIANNTGLSGWLKSNELYDPGITTFVYENTSM